MIRIDKHKQALEALQQVIIRARLLASKESTSGKAIELLDAAEELPMLIAGASDRTEDFEASLKAISERYPYCRNIFAEFSNKAEDIASGSVEKLKAA